MAFFMLPGVAFSNSPMTSFSFNSGAIQFLIVVTYIHTNFILVPNRLFRQYRIFNTNYARDKECGIVTYIFKEKVFL